MAQALIVVLAAAMAAAAACSDAEEASPDASRDAPSSASDASTSDAARTTDAGKGADPERSAVPLPDGEPGIGFDDLQWSMALDRLIVPSGRAGYVGLLDPQSNQVTRLGTLSPSDS